MGHRSDIDAANAKIQEIELGIPLALRYDQDADPPTVAYVGQAQPGTSEAVAGWRIQKLVFGGDGDITVQWADGNGLFDNIWNNRASLSYT